MRDNRRLNASRDVLSRDGNICSLSHFTPVLDFIW